MFLYTVVYKYTRFNETESYPWCKDYGNLPAHILPLVTHRSVKRVWGKCFKIQKNAWWLMMDITRLPIQFERKMAIRNKWNSHKPTSALLKQNSKEEKEMLPFATQYQPLVSTIKEALMEKWDLIQNQPLLCWFFKEPPLIFYKKGKPWQRTCLLQPKY